MRAQLARHGHPAAEVFVKCANAWDDLVACHALTGEINYLLHVYVAGLEDFPRFLLDHLPNASDVADVNSSVVLRTVKRSSSLSLRRLEP